MTEGRFHSDLTHYIEKNDGINANRLLMQELGFVLAKSKSDFVDLLNCSGIHASMSMPDIELINKFIDSIHYNRKLLIGTAYLVNLHNRTSSAEGIEPVSDEGVKAAYAAMYAYFDTCNYEDPSEQYYNADGDAADGSSNIKDTVSNLGKGASGGTAGIIAASVGEAAKLGRTIAEGRNKKNYGGIDLASKKQDAKSQVIQSVLAERQAQADALRKKEEQKAKTMRTVLIVTGSVIGILAIVGAVIAVKNHRNG